jgi:arabinofuranosyltransferase
VTVALQREIGDTAERDADGLTEPEQSVPTGHYGMSRFRTTVLSWLVLAVPLIIVLVGAWTYRWVQEDAFIDFRVIGNLLAGHGPVYNVGERVEVYSDPLWVLLLAVMHEIVPFITLAWLSVLLGLGGTASGVVLAGRGMQRLGSRDYDGVVVPIGLVLFSVVAGVWEFATSGLEMGMVFGWIGLSFWLLVRTEARRRSAVGCAFVVGLGPLVRPELLLMSGVFLAGLAFVIASPDWRGSTRLVRRWVLPSAAAAFLPAAYELWRMAYFAMFVSNSELAKSGGGSDIPQGMTYLWNFVDTYVLWIPLLLALPLVVPRIRRWWSGGDRAGAVVLVTPLLAGTADAIYVVHVGGDYMEARLLLPAFLCCCLPVFVRVGQFRTLMAFPLIGLIVWSSVCVSSLRPGPVTAWVHNMHDERANWIRDTQKPHPIDVSGYGQLLSMSTYIKSAAATATPVHQSMLVLGDPDDAFVIPSKSLPSRAVVDRSLSAFVRSNLGPAKSSLPFHLVFDVDSIGALGYVVGPNVYVYDALSLANPIGSHTTIAVQGIPGHEKMIGPEWMIARFGEPGESFPNVHIFGLVPDAAAARRALNCNPLKSYLGAITQPLTFSQAISNVAHSFTYTTMSFSPDANNAARQLCGS